MNNPATLYENTIFIEHKQIKCHNRLLNAEKREWEKRQNPVSNQFSEFEENPREQTISMILNP